MITSVLTYTLLIPFFVIGQVDFAPRIGVASESPMGIVDTHYNPLTALKLSFTCDEAVDVDFVLNEMSGSSPTLVNLKMACIHMVAPGESMCKLPPREFWPEWVSVLKGLMQITGARAAEIWNEADLDASAHPHLHGCIGDGIAYGEFVAYVYDAVDGQFDIVIGAVSDIRDIFVVDMLSAANGKFDALSFHCYEYFYLVSTHDCGEQYSYATSLIDEPVIISETAIKYLRGPLGDFEISQSVLFVEMVSLGCPFYWYTICGNNWMRTDYCNRPVEYLFMSAYGFPNPANQ